MSHGGGGDSAPLEPNMTPLLDLVLQILMFFIVTVNFATAENTGNVPLPDSQTARPLPKSALKEPIFLNLLVNKDADTGVRRHEVLLPLQLDASGKPLPPMNQAEARRYMKRLFDDLSRVGEVKNPVVIRAHKEADYNEVFQVLQSCSDAGFRNLKVRALVK